MVTWVAARLVRPPDLYSVLAPRRIKDRAAVFEAEVETLIAPCTQAGRNEREVSRLHLRLSPDF